MRVPGNESSLLAFQSLYNDSTQNERTTMKVSSVELAELEHVISGIDTPVLRDRFRTEFAAGRIPVVKDIEVFYRWFVYHRACDDGFRFEKNYADAHIDTALRRVIDPLGKN